MNGKPTTELDISVFMQKRICVNGAKIFYRILIMMKQSWNVKCVVTCLFNLPVLLKVVEKAAFTGD